MKLSLEGVNTCGCYNRHKLFQTNSAPVFEASLRKKKKKNSESGFLGRTCRVLGHLTLWLFLGVAGYWAWLDKEVYETFESASWSLPAKVFARPLEIYAGAQVSTDRLVYELTNLGYQNVAMPSRPGEYQRSKGVLQYYSRGYKFWDGEEYSDLIRVDFDGRRVKRVTSVGTEKQIHLTRMEPILIGSINPKSYEDRILLEYDDVSETLIDTLVAVEDHRFFDHYGFDLVGLLRATLSNIKARAYVQGGSTITQQLVKNFYLTRERTLRRKITELLMSISLELRFSKDKILEVYINEVFLGQDGNRAIHGFGLASEFYFGKPLNELDIPAIACLVGMVKGPSALNPRSFPFRAKERRDFVLSVMQKRGLISSEQQDLYSNFPLETKSIKSERKVNPAGFLDLVKRQLKAQYDQTAVREAGLKIYTTVDSYLQEKALRALRSSIRNLEGASVETDMLQAACVIVDPRTGEILTLLGGLRDVEGDFNRAMDAKRQVGSMIKPFIYALALSDPKRYSLISSLEDREIQWELEDGTLWAPKNFDGKVRGDIPLLESLISSQNLATVNLGADLGIDEVTNYLKKMGLPGSTRAYPAILLGAVQLSPLKMAEMYTVFANGGFSVPLRSILEVTTNTDEIVRRYPIELKPAIEQSTSVLIRHALTLVMERGTGKSIKNTSFDISPVAGKTGTSDDYRDSWFVGFGENRLGTIWVGRDDNLPTGLTGSSGALKVWSKIMAHANLNPLTTELSPSIVFRSVDLLEATGVPENCPNAELIPFHNTSRLSVSNRCLRDFERTRRGPRQKNLYKRGQNRELFKWLKDLFN